MISAPFILVAAFYLSFSFNYLRKKKKLSGCWKASPSPQNTKIDALFLYFFFFLNILQKKWRAMCDASELTASNERRQASFQNS